MTDEPVFDIERIGSRFIVTTNDERFAVYRSLPSLAEAKAEIEQLLAHHRQLVAETLGEPCRGEHCGGRGVVADGDELCRACSEVEYGVWLAGEPD